MSSSMIPARQAYMTVSFLALTWETVAAAVKLIPVSLSFCKSTAALDA